MNINKIILMGRLTADPELQMSASNVPVLRFTVAVNRRVTNAQRDDGRPTAVPPLLTETEEEKKEYEEALKRREYRELRRRENF